MQGDERSMQLNQNQHSLAVLGLDLDSLRQQQEAVSEALSRGFGPQFKILDTCRFDNGGLITLAQLPKQTLDSPGRGVVAFVPAAGAASRYAAPLTPLRQALELRDVDSAKKCLADLIQCGALDWPLPPNIKLLLQQETASITLSEASCLAILREIGQPKALMPCVKEGISFLQLKNLEHQELTGLEGQVFVVPTGMSQVFAECYSLPQLADLHLTNLATGFVEQGPRLSTIRVRRDGSPYIEPDGRFSVVPAGHGALASLFPKVRETASAATTLFIRNIDNVTGTRAVAQSVTEHFLSAHRFLLDAFVAIRSALVMTNLRQAAEIAESLLSALSLPFLEDDHSSAVNRFLDSISDHFERSLWSLLLKVVHTPLPRRSDRSKLIQLYSRPVNLLGQVPNTGKDIGGTPCFISTRQGRVKLCLEVPHASEIDKQDFLANPSRATHFNPVFAAAEIPADDSYYARSNKDFWLLSEKTYRGEQVVYYETVLYELLGNSFLANVIFVEVSRDVFNPHKTLLDGAGRSVKDWT